MKRGMGRPKKNNVTTLNVLISDKVDIPKTSKKGGNVRNDDELSKDSSEEEIIA